MIDLLPFQMIPLIQLWATISVLFFYQSFFEKHPLEAQLNELNNSFDLFYEQFQGFIEVPDDQSYNNYLSVKWDSFFISIKRMTTLIFFYSIFLLFYLVLYRYSHEHKDVPELYHSKNICFLVTTNLYLLFWLSWHLIKPIRKISKRSLDYIKERFEKALNNKRKLKKYIKNKWALENLSKLEESLKKERLEKKKAFWSPKKKLLSNNIRLIIIYFLIFFFFFLVLLWFFIKFEEIDTKRLSLRFVFPFFNENNPTLETITTSLSLFLVVPIFIYTRIFVDACYIWRLRKKLSVLPNREDTYLLLDLLSKPKESIQKMSSTQIIKDVKKWKRQGDIIDKQDIRKYLEYKANLVITALEKSYLDIDSDNPVKGEKFTQNQEFQLRNIFKKQIAVSYEKIRDSIMHIIESQPSKSQEELEVVFKSKPSPRKVSKVLKYLYFKELRKSKKFGNKKSNKN